MLDFATFLAEGLNINRLDKAALLISKYLKKKTAMTLFKYPGVEEYKNETGKGFGMRFFIPKKGSSIRFNWHQAATMGLTDLESITFWNGISDVPYQLKFDTSVSIIKALPLLVDVIKTGKVPNSFYTLPDDVPLSEEAMVGPGELLSESAFGIPEVFDGVVDFIQSPNFKKSKVYDLYKTPGYKIFDELEKLFPDLIVKEGIKYFWRGSEKDIARLKAARDRVLEAIGAVSGSVSRGKATENYRVSDDVKAIEDDRERLTFEMQLVDLENLLKLTISGASNALFVAGKGGVGKTHTTEKILAEMGLRDGAGYFKNTGSASAAGIYSLLFKYKNDIIFFDDSDDALGDQEARNIFKAATDTKKIRKLVWNKMGKNMADPEEMTDDEIIEAGMIPKYFEFTGKVIFISNLPLNKLDPDGAIRTRAFVINIDPTEMEIYDFMEKIVDTMKLEAGLSLDSKARKHVVDLLRQTTSKEAPNLRKLSRGLNMAAGAIAAGVAVSDTELKRLIQSYA